MFDTFSQWIDSLRKHGLFKGYKSVILTIFLKPNPTSSLIATILQKILPGNEFAGTAIIEGLEFRFPANKYKSEKKLIIFSKSGLHSYKIYVLNKMVQDDYLPFPTKMMKRTLEDIINIVCYTFHINICEGQSIIGFEDVVKIRGTQLVNNEKEHIPFAFLENNEQFYRQRLEKKIENEEEEVSNEIANIIHIVTENINNKNMDISNLHPIFQELIRIQSKKPKGIKYHPIKSGLLWDQHRNCYVGYLDFEDEINEYQEFVLQCQLEIESTNSSFNNVTCNKQKHNLVTQVHQFIWYSITHNFSFPISYYGINNITVHSLNFLIFELAAKLECVGIHTIGSICDRAGENQTHIKNKKSFHKAKIIKSNFEKTKFIVSLLDNSKTIEVNRTYIRLPMLSKSKWEINEMCEYKSPKDNQWYLAKIVDYNSDDIIVEIFENMEKWKVFSQCINDFLRPVYNVHELSAYYRSVNPITGEDYNTGEKNSRKIILNGKEISWRHIKGVYEYTKKHVIAKTTKFTKKHIYLTSWSKMRVNLAEQTLSKKVEDTLTLIEELKEISEETRNFIKYLQIYRQIIHSKINFQLLKDPCIKTLKKIRDWFINGDIQKKKPRE
ncbi:hypothetical protein Glove_590g2 [Diversispora epigaea]|uniref:Uncharacterized protein n=1 Tax=Diversispora epigaea TaxID=1348612 RepID=A0A397GGA7_9GLOM|nr:hypothetical protein Glove_590g2 [Diversispora epigaea]